MSNSPDPLSLLPPTPEMQPVQVRPAEAPQPSYGQGAGFMGKTGTAAAIAAPLLEGWIAGKQIKAQREQQQAQTKLAGSRNLFAMSVEGYRNWLENNPDAKPEEKAHRLAAVQQARDAYAGVMEQYVTPEKASTRGGRVKQGVKKALGAPTPELFAQTAVKAFQNQPLEDLVAPDAMRKLQMEREKTGIEGEKQGIKASQAQVTAEQERTKDLQEQREQRAQSIKDNDEWSSLYSKQGRTPEEEKRLGELNAKLDKNTEQQAKNAITQKLMTNQKLTTGEETAARAFGLVQPDQTRMLQDATGAWYMVKVTADGKVNKTPLGVKGQLPKINTPGYYESISGLARAYQEATPGLSRQDAMSKAISAFAQAPGEGNITGQKLTESFSRALKETYNSILGPKIDPNKDAEGAKQQQMQQNILNEFYERAGTYYGLKEKLPEPVTKIEGPGLFRALMGDVTSTAKTTVGGFSADDVQKMGAQIRARLGDALAHQGLKPEQIDSILESYKPLGIGQLEPPQQVPGQQQGQVEAKKYRVTGTDGKTMEFDLNDAQLKRAQSAPGFKVEPVESGQPISRLSRPMLDSPPPSMGA